MRRDFIKENQTSEVVYAESLNRLISHNHYFSFLKQAPSVLFISTQAFYENYYDRFGFLFNGEGTFNWYICPDTPNLNNINTYQRILTYIEEMKLPTGTALVAAGSDKIHYLCSVLEQSSIYLKGYTYIPTSMSGFLAGLSGKGKLVNEQNIVTSECFTLPERLIYDTMLSELEAPDKWTEDFFQLLKLSLYSSNDLFELLSAISFHEQRPWTPYVEQVIDCFEKETLENDLMIGSLKKGFYQLTESHYITLQEKEQISFLLYFLWCLKKETIPFDFPLMVKWLKEVMGSSLSLPKVMNTYELAESITMELGRLDKGVSLSQIGVMKESPLPTMEEMYHVIESYREI